MRFVISILLNLWLGLGAWVWADTTKPLLFAGTDKLEGQQLWQTDNTASGTKILTYLTKTPNGDSKPYPIGTIGKWGVFVAFTPETGHELWRTDGTPQGTSLLKELVAGADSGMREGHSFLEPASVQSGQRLVFWSHVPQGLALTSSNGMPEGTQIIQRFPAQTNNDEPRFYTLGDLQFFYVDDGKTGLEWWRSDGTRAGTRLVVDATQGSKQENEYSFGTKPLTQGKLLYFLSADHEGAQNLKHTLWRTDGSKTQAIHKLTLTQSGSLSLVALDDHYLIYNHENSADFRSTLWALDLNTQQAQSLPRFNTATPDDSLQPSMTTTLLSQGKLYVWLEHADQATTQSLWVTDLSANTTTQILTLPNPNPEYKAPPEMFTFADRVYFFNKDGVRPAQLWTTDGTVKGTVKLMGHEGGKYAGGSGDSWFDTPHSYVLRSEYLIFPTFTPKGHERSQLWSLSTANPAKPALLGEFDDPYLLRPADSDQGKVLYFISGKQRFQTDGTRAGTRALGAEPTRTEWEPMPWPASSLVQSLALPTSPPSWWVSHQDSKTGTEPWVISADLKQTQLLKDINTHPASADLDGIQSAGGYSYWRMGWHLWMSDGTATKTQRVTAIPDSEHFESGIYSMAVSGDSLYVRTENAQKLQSLWQVQAGKAKRLKTFATGYVWLLPSSNGVYELFFPEAGGHELTHRHATGTTQTLMQESKDANPALNYSLETAQGLLYITTPHFNTIDSANPPPIPKNSLWLRPTGSTQAVLLSAELDTPALLSHLLLPTANQVYVQNELPGETPRLYRIDFKARELVELPLTIPSESTASINTRTTTKGLYLQTRTAGKEQLWFWADGATQAQLLHEFPDQPFIELAHSVGDTLYFNVRTEVTNSGDLWMSQGTPDSTKLVKAGVMMRISTP